MTTLWIFSALLGLLALVFIWRHFFKTSLYQANQANMRGETNKDLYYEHLRELEKDFAEGGIDKENFDYLKEELDHSLLLDMQASDKEQQAKDKKTSMIWPATMSAFIIIFSGVFYYQGGAYGELELAQMHKSDAVQGDMSESGKIIAQLKLLHQEVKKNPKNSDAWFRLGQILTNVGEYDSAVIAFDKVIEVEGEQADIFAMQAQALYYKNNQQRNAEIDSLIERALAIDEKDAATLMLVGMDHFQNQRFAKAAESWQIILDNNPNSANSAALLDAINTARAQANMEALSAQQPKTSAETLTVEVSLSEEVIATLTDDKVVFIYALANDGVRAPLAAVKMMASDLPAVITLDDSNAMMPQRTISSVDTVSLQAVLSQAGTPGQKAGDYKAQVNNIKVKNNQQTVNLVIDTLVE